MRSFSTGASTPFHRTGPALLLALALAASASPARAADPKAPGGADAQADQLFREARALLDQGRYREACRTFERSLEIQASPGTLLNLGNCYEQDGDLARALSTFERAVADSQLEQNEVRRKAWTDAGNQRKDSLLARVPVLNLTPSPTPGASVRLDGEALTQVLGPVRLNPGHHTLEVSAPGKRTLTKELELHISERAELVLPVLEDAAVAAAPAAAPVPAQVPPAASSGASPWPWVLVGSGALLATAGVVTGFMAKSKEKELEEGCGPGPDCANPDLRSTRDSGEALELATYVLWAAGGASMIAGFTLFALDSGEKEKPTQVSLGCFGPSCGLRASGSF